MTFLDDVRVVRGCGARSRLQVAGLRSQSHRRAKLRHVLLFREQVDHGVRGGRIELAGVGAGESADAARDLDHGALEAEADPEERYLLLARESGGIHLALDTADTESARDQDAVHRRE